MIRIVEVGPRDGLQNETAIIPTATKIAFIDHLSDTGVDEIEVSAFVSPKWVPQLSDASEVFDGITRRQGLTYSALVPNPRGLERALVARVDKVSVFTAASETFNRKNINATLSESIQRFTPVALQALGEGIALRGYVSTAFWCAFEGKIDPMAVVDVIDRLNDIGIQEFSISDTIGRATPEEVEQLLERLLAKYPAERMAMHFHDTYGRAVANTLASYRMGIRAFDASAGGLGGCPYAPGATGNVATDAVVHALKAAGEAVPVDLDKLEQARRLLDPYLKDDLRTIPEDGSPACAACEYATGEVCCRKKEIASAQV